MNSSVSPIIKEKDRLLPIPMHAYYLLHFLHPSCPDLQRLPPPIIDVRLQLTGDEAGHAVAQPQVAEEGVVALLVQEQLAAVAQAHVHLAVLVDVGRVGEAAALAVQHEHHAAADVEEEAYCLLASIFLGGVCG